MICSFSNSQCINVFIGSEDENDNSSTWLKGSENLCICICNLYLVMNIILLFHLINGVQLLYRLLKIVLQGGEEVSVSGSEHVKRYLKHGQFPKKQNKTMYVPLIQRAHLQASRLSGF